MNEFYPQCKLWFAVLFRKMWYFINIKKYKYTVRKDVLKNKTADYWPNKYSDRQQICHMATEITMVLKWKEDLFRNNKKN